MDTGEKSLSVANATKAKPGAAAQEDFPKVSNEIY